MWISYAQPPCWHIISAKIQKNIQKSDYMDGFCLQSELDLTLFYKIEGCWGIFWKTEILNDLNDRDLNDRIHEYMYPYTLWGSLLVMSKLPNFVLGRYWIVLDGSNLFLSIIWVSPSVSSWVSWVPSWVPLHYFSLPHFASDTSPYLNKNPWNFNFS